MVLFYYAVCRYERFTRPEITHARPIIDILGVAARNGFLQLNNAYRTQCVYLAWINVYVAEVWLLSRCRAIALQREILTGSSTTESRSS